MTDKKKRYSEICQTETNIPIFSQDWWLDCVCGQDGWDILLVEQGTDIVATMPIAFQKKYGLNIIGQPLLTQTLGPWIKYPANQKYEAKLAYERKVLSKIIDEIPKASAVRFNCQPSFTNWLPFCWGGFGQTTRYTYVLDDISDYDKVWSEFKGSIRTEIKKAKKQLEVVVDDSAIDQLYTLASMVFSRQGLKTPYSSEFLTRLAKACISRNQGRIYVAKDDSDRVHATIFVVWDKLKAYYLVGGSNPDLRSSGAISLLIDTCLKDISLFMSTFDFEGSMVKNIEKYFSSFGSKQTPYFQISKTDSFLLKSIDLIRS